MIAQQRGSRAGLHALLRAVAQRWLVLAEFPFVVNPLRLAFSGRPYIENYRWKPELGTRIHLMSTDRLRTRSGPFETEARFGFHHVNSYEDGEDVVVDVCTYPDAGIVEDLYLERLRAGKPIAPAQLERFRLSPATGEVVVERLLDEPIELPRINYGRCNERPYRYVWGVGVGSGWLDRIVKGDVVAADEHRVARGRVLSPASRCSSPPPTAGTRTRACCSQWCLTGTSGNSFLLVLDAATPGRAGPRRGPPPRSRSDSTGSSRSMALPGTELASAQATAASSSPNSSRMSANRSGASTCGQWPIPGSSSSLAPGTWSRIRWAPRWKTSRSRSPHTTSTRAVIRVELVGLVELRQETVSRGRSGRPPWPDPGDGR